MESHCCEYYGGIVMSEQEVNRVDVNQASHEELVAVPGIGPVLAARMIEKRPFASLDDLTSVQGINTQLLEKLGSYLSVSAAPQSERVIELPASLVEEPQVEVEPEIEAAAPQPELEQASEPEPQLEVKPPVEMPAVDEVQVVEGEPVELDEAVMDEKTASHEPEAEKSPSALRVVQNAPPHQEKPPAGEPAAAITRWELLTYTIGAALISLILAVAFVLGLLAVINGGLAYPTSERLNALQREVDSLSDDAQTLQKDMGGLRTRLDNLEAISGRVDGLEEETQALRSELDSKSKQVETMQAQVNQMTEQMTKLQQRSDIFDRFLGGLSGLLDEVNTPAQ
jgi:competence protein ComEA